MLVEDARWSDLRKGEVTAFTNLYKAYYQFLFTCGFRLCANREMIKDWLHELFLELWNKHEQLPPVQHIGSYLRTMLQRRIMHEMQRQPDLPGNIADDVAATPIEHSYEELLVQLQSREEQKEKVKRAMGQLTNRQFEIIRLRFFEEKSYEEIAAGSNTSTRTVYNQVYEALKVLRKHLSLFVVCCLWFVVLLISGFAHLRICGFLSSDIPHQFANSLIR